MNERRKSRTGNFLIGLGALALIYLICFLILKDDTKDAMFLSVTSLVGMSIAMLVSPDRNLIKGAQKLWLFEWALIAIVAYLPTRFLPPHTSVVVIAAHYVYFFSFFLAFLIVARRGRKLREA